MSNNLLRFETTSTCKECRQFSAHCDDGQQCQPVRQKLRDYEGIRLTADGFDCALPVTIDSHSICSFGCVYCFADNLMGHYVNTATGGKQVGQTKLSSIESIFSGKPGKFADTIREALRYDRRNAHGFPCPVQLGGICDAGDNIERQQGWLLKFIDLAITYNQPVRMSTKGNLFLLDEYLNAIRRAPHLFWVAFSIITPDDEMIRKVDIGAPTATERLQSMKRLSDIGVKTSLRFRPILPGISDRTWRIPNAYKVLIDKAADAGARAVSAEVAFLPLLRKPLDEKWKYLQQITRLPLIDIYKSFGGLQSCTRPPYQWTEEIMHRIQAETHAVGMSLGVSDPVWKQLGDFGCCCGIDPTDPIFGNWQPENCTNALIKAKHGENSGLLRFEDICPSWAYKVTKDNLCSGKVGPIGKASKRYDMWADALQKNWNNPTAQRSPLNYFQGALVIDHTDAHGNYVYRYVGLERQYKVPTYWKFTPQDGNKNAVTVRK